MASTTVAPDPFPSDSDKEIVSTNVTVTNPNSESDSFTLNLVVNTACGAIAGYVVGYGFKGSVAQTGSNAKMFAVYSCIQSFVESYLKSIRGKHDVYSAGVAGCVAGIALSYQGGGPLDPLQSCVLHGAVSSILEDHKQSFDSFGQQVNGILPPLSLSLPNELKDSFSSFCKSLHQGPR